MAARSGCLLDQEGAHLGGELGESGRIKGPQVGGRVDRLEEAHDSLTLSGGHELRSEGAMACASSMHRRGPAPLGPRGDVVSSGLGFQAAAAVSMGAHGLSPAHLAMDNPPLILPAPPYSAVRRSAVLLERR